LYKVYAALANLKNTQPLFRSADFALSLNGLSKRIRIDDATTKLVILGNFDVAPASVNPNFPVGGKWYDYFTGASIDVADPTANLLLQPREFHLLTTVPWPKPETDIVTPWPLTLANSAVTAVGQESPDRSIDVYPNPAERTVSISLENPYLGEVEIILRDANGQWIKSQKLKKTERVFSHELNMESLGKGFYVAELRYGNQSATRKIIRN
jgi:hypothetical protein